MKQRITGILLVLCMLLALLPSVQLTALARSETDIAYPVEGGNIYFDKSRKEISSCDKTVTSAIIPSEIDGVAVEWIGAYSFADCINLKRVVIPDSVTTVVDSAFDSCYALESVKLGENVEYLGQAVFNCCSSLKSIVIPEKVTAIRHNAFYGCKSLELILFGDSLESIGDHALADCTSLTYLSIPATVTDIYDGAFSGCKNLTSVQFLGDAPKLWGTPFSKEYYDNMVIFCLHTTSGWDDPAWSGMTIEPIHVYYGVITEPTCTEQGYTTFTCDCGDSFVENYVDALGHSYYDGVCIRCGEKDPGDKPTDPVDPKPTVSFVDVKGDEWFAEAVNYAVSNGLMNGMGGNKFEPNTGMTRAMLVTVLWRYAGSPIEGENTFTDLTQDWYIPAVTWAAHNGIVGGVGNGKFDPDANITREQMAAILYRYSNFIGADTFDRVDLSSFPDARKVSSYAEEALSWAVASGLITGTKEGSKTYLDPLGNATRAQVATILMRYIEGMGDAPEIQFLGVEDAYSDTKTYQGKLCCYHIPKAVFSGIANPVINEKIYSELYDILEQNLYGSDPFYELGHMVYNWGQKGNVVSICVEATGRSHYYCSYWLYNISAKNGAELTKEDTLRNLGVGQADYESMLKSAIDHYYTEYIEENNLSGGILEAVQKCWNHALEEATLEYTTPFVGSNGHLCAFLYVYTPYGAEQYSSLFDLETLEEITITCNQHG